MFSNSIMTNGNLWTNFVKDWATDNGTSYMTAIKDPSLSTAYKQRKKDTKREAKASQFQSMKEDAIALAETITPFPEKRARGRPIKYVTDEERKEAKREKTLTSTRKKRQLQKEECEENITLTLGEM
jgi:hypothetical protein